MSDEGGSNSIDDIWNSLKSMESNVQEEYRERANTTHLSSVNAAMDFLSQKQKGRAKTKKTKKGDVTSLKPKASKKASPPVISAVELEDLAIEVAAQEGFMQKISRDLNSVESPDAKERARALTHILVLLKVEYSMSIADYNEAFGDLCRPIFKRYADTSEKCRDLAFKVSLFLFENSADFVPILGYFIPALLQRAPATLAYDAEMQVFVWDAETHDAFRRGRAVDRQDKNDVTSPVTHLVVEPSEEVRLLTCQALTALVRRVAAVGAQSVLNPYFADIILFLQAQVRDPFPDLKVEAVRALEFLALQREYEEGMCYFAVALVRTIMPAFRHRHARVRAAAVDSLRACVSVPNRAKRKGAGTDAISELVGFKEDNVLQVAAFYKTEVSVNYLAEITGDASATVRERVAIMLTYFLTELDDRYDHQTRLLPYLIDLLGDEHTNIQRIAVQCLTRCGQQYEEEHHDDIIERRQYGIDGDDRCNMEKSLPAPFTERPRIGIRIYVRGNTKRFIFALVGELTNWQSKTRLKSAKLLKYIIVLCEEYLTMEAHKLIPAYIKALGFARDDGDKDLESLLCEICELSGRYTAPESYVHYILPRLRGDVDIVQFGVDSGTRCCVMTALRCMLDGSKASLIPALLSELIDCIVDPYVIDIESPAVHSTALELMNTLLSRVQGKGLAATEAHFQSTGRLKSMKETITKAFKFLFLSLQKSDTRQAASQGLTYLSSLDFDTRVLGVPGLFARQIPAVVSSAIQAAGEGDDLEVHLPGSPDFIVLLLALACPWRIVQGSMQLLTSVLQYILRCVTKCTSYRLGRTSIRGMVITESTGCAEVENLEVTLLMYNDLLLSALNNQTSSAMYQFLAASGVQNSCDVPDIGPQLKQALCDSFVIHSSWASSNQLQGRRLETLAVLVHSTHQSVLKDLFNDRFLLLFENVFSNTSAASTPLDIRRQSVCLMHDIIAACIDEHHRVICYEKRMASNETSNCPLSDANVSTAVLKILMNISLDDSSDDIRVKTLEALMYVVPFIQKNKDPTEAVPASHTFEGVVDRLLHRAVDGNPTVAFLDMLDGVLRSVAVLSPAEFEVLLRENFRLLTGVHKAPSSASDLFSGLVDHCEMMIQFNSK